MSVRSLMVVALALVVVVSLAGVWFYPSLQDFMLANPFWNGLRDFTTEFNATWVDSLSGISRNPKTATLVAIPYLDYAPADLEEVHRFVQEGGLLLLLDDYGYGNSLLHQMGLPVKFSGLPLLDPLFDYRNEKLPRITDFNAELAGGDVRAVVLNHGTALEGVDPARVLAWSSPSSFIDLNQNGVYNKEELKGPFPVAAKYRLGDGTALLLSDPSILVNSMVGRDDNRAFLKHLFDQYGPGREILVDVAHLPKTPLDESKLRLTQARKRVAHPYSVAAILGVVVFLALTPLQRREPIGNR